jgi:hypothetical protein
VVAVGVVGPQEHWFGGEDGGEGVGCFLSEADHSAGAGLVELFAQGWGFLGEGARDQVLWAGPVGQFGLGELVCDGEGLIDRGDAVALRANSGFEEVVGQAVGTTSGLAFLEFNQEFDFG